MGANDRLRDYRAKRDFGRRRASSSSSTPPPACTGTCASSATERSPVRIAPTLLPHLPDRPLTLRRFPNGVDGETFYEKHAPAHRPPWVETVPVYSSSERRRIDFCLAQDAPTLAWIGNQAAIELHPSLARASDLCHPRPPPVCSTSTLGRPDRCRLFRARPRAADRLHAADVRGAGRRACPRRSRRAGVRPCSRARAGRPARRPIRPAAERAPEVAVTVNAR